jgi:hypothetical protein
MLVPRRFSITLRRPFSFFIEPLACWHIQPVPPSSSRFLRPLAFPRFRLPYRTITQKLARTAIGPTDKHDHSLRPTYLPLVSLDETATLDFTTSANASYPLPPAQFCKTAEKIAELTIPLPDYCDFQQSSPKLGSVSPNKEILAFLLKDIGLSLIPRC